MWIKEDNKAQNVHKKIKLGQKPQDGCTKGQPFPSGIGGSINFRIPGIVTLKDGTMVVCADARWNLEKDGGGLDLVVSRSKDHGETWEYSFVGYLGDNGNEWNPESSTLMDPLLMTDGEKLYLFADLFPAGYSISSVSTTYIFSDKQTGFDEEGHLLLSTDGRKSYQYYLHKGKIYHRDGEEQKGYTVDEWFHLYYKEEYISNIFFADAPFQACATSYICMMTSVDGGKTWSAPKLLNTKNYGTVWMGLGPGKGLITKDGTMMFSAYDGQHAYLVYSKDEGVTWNTIRTEQANNESQLVELEDGTIRMFVKSAGVNKIQYIDFLPEDGTYRLSEFINTGVDNFSNCMVSVMRYSKKIRGKEVLLVSCPSDSDGGMWAGRFAGKLYIFLLEDKNKMTLAGNCQINDGFFAYSCMAEWKDGSIDLVYEDNCICYEAGNYYGTCSHITYQKVPASILNDILKVVNDGT